MTKNLHIFVVKGIQNVVDCMEHDFCDTPPLHVSKHLKENTVGKRHPWGLFEDSQLLSLVHDLLWALKKNKELA